MNRHGLLDSGRRIAALAWPVFIGQVAVLALSTADTVMIARYGAMDLAALAVGAAVYSTVFVGLMGVVLAISPITGQLFGARQLQDAGEQFRQALWLALGLSAFGCLLLLFPGPFLALAHAQPEMEVKVRAYLSGLAFALPPALLFTAFRGFNTAISRPKVVMAIQLGGLVAKLPLNAMLIYGATLPLPGGHVLAWPALGATGCGIATAVVMWAQLLLAWAALRRDPFYDSFGLHRAGLGRPHPQSQRALLKLGVPMGLSILIEATGFTFMAIFISRIGATAVAGHQLAANLIALMFMMPLAIANATTTLVAQSVGAAMPGDARRFGWHGLQLGVLISAVIGLAVYLGREAVLGAYTHDPVIIAAALPLLAWVAVFHTADAAQTIGSFILRAYRVTTAPLVIYAVAIWGVGLGGGFSVAFNTTGLTPVSLQGAQGFWFAATAGLSLSGIGMCAFLAWMLRASPRR